MSTLLKTKFPMLIVLVIGLTMILDFFVRMPELQGTATFLSESSVIVAAFALGLGVVNLVWIHARNIVKRAKGQWMHSIVLLFGLFAVLGPGLVAGTNNPVFKFFFDNVIAVAGTSVYAVLSFYTVAGAYRAFRARNIYASVMMVVGAIVFLGMVPIGEVMSPAIPKLSDWLSSYPNVGAVRAVQLGTAVAAVVLSIKTFAGIERPYMGIEGGE